MIENFANYLSLTIWDWLAFFIATCSFFVATISLLIARKTLSSQRNTERNTLPLFTKENQYSTFYLLAFELLTNYIDALSIRVVLSKIDGSRILSDINMSNLLMNTSEIHLELFYNSNCSKDLSGNNTYTTVSKVKKGIEKYNRMCELIASHLMNPIIDHDTILKEYDCFIIKELHNLLLSFQIDLERIFNVHGEIQELFAYLIINNGSDSFHDSRIDKSEKDISILKKMVDKEIWKLLMNGYNYSQYVEAIDFEKFISFIYSYVLGNIKYGREIIVMPVRKRQ